MEAESRGGRYAIILECFVLANMAFLGGDIFLAHSVNAFARPVEWLPIGFSVAATAALAVALPRTTGHLATPWRRRVGGLVGLAAVCLGIGGMLFHLESQFFALQSIRSLVYTAPFVAPLAYTGLGLLLLMNRMVAADSEEWGRWVVFFALGGVVGNFVLTLCDHAQNGFFHVEEWVPVVVCALTAGFLTTAVITGVDRSFLLWCGLVVLIHAAVGGLGLAYHLAANAQGPAENIRDNFLYGAPLFAPLLLTNLSALATLGLAHLWLGMPPR